jgi:hypothetical protein
LKRKTIPILSIIFYTFILFPVATSYADSVEDSTPVVQKKATELPWAVLGYYSRMTNDTLGSVVGMNWTLNEETLYSLEFTHVLPPENIFRRLLKYLVSTIEMNANFTYRDDPAGPIYEVNPYFALRWANFPWDKYLTTTIAVGEGISYDSRVPTVEINDSGNTKKLLNFLMAEVTFALPKHPNVELVARMHHRSGAYGVYGAGNSGSTAVGLGIRYRF